MKIINKRFYLLGAMVALVTAFVVGYVGRGRIKTVAASFLRVCVTTAYCAIVFLPLT